MTSTIWWIRRDLRIANNAALQAALDDFESIIPLFILDPTLLNSSNVGPRRISFLMHGLKVLHRDLLSHGSRLIIRKGDPQKVLSQLMAETPIERIFAQADFSPYARKRDSQIAAHLPLTLVGGPAIHPPGTILKKDGTPYTVFTPYSRQWLIRDLSHLPRTMPNRIKTPAKLHSSRLPEPIHPASEQFPPGESAGADRLDQFTSGRNPPIFRYGGDRDRMDRDGTSTLSPYLRFGMISPQVCIQKAIQAQSVAPDRQSREGVHAWINELAWRDFYLSILYHFPHVVEKNFRPSMDTFRWNNDSAAFERWKAGETGFPVVDAAMRQLLETGWMHNRARMITASFLTKDLLIHWRWGERWFMRQLIDGDPAANNGGWQWVAGSGSDAAPYFRIFNPITQSKKFDPSGVYIRRWVPALKSVSDRWIHEPWKMSEDLQNETDCRIDVDYPSPIVDHQWARKRALDSFKQMST